MTWPNRFWAIHLSVATHVWRDRMKTRHQRAPSVMSPRIPGLGKSATKQDKRSAALFCDVHMECRRFAHFRCHARARRIAEADSVGIALRLKAAIDDHIAPHTNPKTLYLAHHYLEERARHLAKGGPCQSPA
jgi:hypothetical protein